MDFKKVGKVLLPIGAALLSVASAVVNNKNQEAQMNEAVAKKVAEALAEKAEEV